LVRLPFRRPAPRMEHLWSRADANGGDPPQVLGPLRRLKQAESVADDCR
jgi:hypothetical protein